MADAAPSADDLYRRIQAAKASGAGSAAAPDAAALWKSLQEAKGPEKPGVGAALWEGLKRGGRDVLEQGASVGARMMQAGPEEGAGAFDVPAQRQAAAASVAPEMQRSAQAYAQSPAVQQHPAMAGAGRVGGNVAASAPMMAVPGASGAGMALGGRALLGAGMGAATGGAPGAVAGAATGGLAGAIGPRIAPAFQKIMQEFPNFTQMVTGAAGRTAESFQRATANEVLQPITTAIGQAIPRTVKVGHDLINYVGDKLDDAYNRVLPKVTFRAAEPDPNTGATFTSGLKSLAEDVPEAHKNDFTRLVKRQFENRLDEAGNMDGDAYKRTNGEISRLVRRYSGSGATADNKEYAEVLRNLQANMRDTLQLHNPTEAPALQKIDQAWARYVRMQEASGRRVDSNGEFMPNDLLMASRKGAGNRAFSQGDLLMQKFGEAGNELLSGRQPNVQKHISELIGSGVGAGAGSMIGGTMGAGTMGAVIGAGVGKAAGAAARPALDAIAGATQKPAARAIGAAVGRTAPVAGAAADEATGKRESYVSTVGP